MADTTLIPTQSWMLKTLHTRVFTKKTARDCRYIGVKYHTAWSPTTQAPDMRLSAELWDPKARVRSCTFRRTLCIREQKKKKNAEGEATYTNNIFFFKAHTRIYTHYVVCDWRLTLNSLVCVSVCVCGLDNFWRQTQTTNTNNKDTLGLVVTKLRGFFCLCLRLIFNHSWFYVSLFTFCYGLVLPLINLYEDWCLFCLSGLPNCSRSDLYLISQFQVPKFRHWYF